MKVKLGKVGEGRGVGGKLLGLLWDWMKEWE